MSPKVASDIESDSAAMKDEKEVPVDSKEPAKKTLDSRPLSPLRSRLFLFGMAVVGAGLWIARSEQFVSPRFSGPLDILDQYVHTYPEVAVGGGLLLLGALIAAFAARELLPDRLAGKPLSGAREWSFHRSRPALVGGLMCYAAVIVLVLREETSPLVFYLFVFSLALIGHAIHRSDSGPSGTELEFRRIDGVILPTLTLLIVSLNLVELTHWRFSYIGDEGAFFEMAKYLSEGGRRSLFDLVGVYETHPILDSAYQSLFLKIFGADIIGWRLAGIFGLAASAALIYILVLLLFGRIPAIVAAVVLGSNHVLMAFARIGYNNLHCVFSALLVLLFLVLAWRTGRAVFVFLTGIAMGFCIYSFAVGFLIWPIVALLVAIGFLRRPTVRELAAVGLMLAGFLLVITPGLLTTSPEHLLDLAVHHSRREVAAEDPTMVARFSLVRSFLVFWVNPQWFKLYVGGPLLDAVTTVLFSIGFAVGLMHIHKGVARVAFVWFVMGLLIVAFTNYVPDPLFTRLLFLIPACAIMAATGAFCLEAALRGIRLPAWAAIGVILGLTAVIPVLNLHQLLVKSPKVLRVKRPMITVKALQENPGQFIVEVGEEPDRNELAAVSRYPQLREHFAFSEIDELLLPPTPMGREDKMPIYLLHDGSQFGRLRQMLPPAYLAETHAGPNGYFNVWYFKPTKWARPKPEPGQRNSTRIDNPEIVLEVRLRPIGGAARALPQDVAVGPDGSFFVACSGDNTIRKYGSNGVPLETWGNTDPAHPVFEELFAIAAGPDGTLYALDAGARRILRFNPAGEIVTAPIQDVGYFPRGLGVESNGELLVADTGGGKIRRLGPNGSQLAVVDAPILGEEPLSEPIDVAVVEGEKLIVFYARDFVLACLGPEGNIEASWPIPGVVPASRSGHFAVDAEGRIFLCNASKGRVVIFDTAGQRLALWPQPRPEKPVGILVDQQDGVYVTYPEQDLVRKYRLRKY